MDWATLFNVTDGANTESQDLDYRYQKRQNVNKKKNIKQRSSYLPNPGAVEKKNIMEKERQERVEVEIDERIWGWERAGSGIEVLTEDDGL